MVNTTYERQWSYKLQDLLTEKQIQQIVKKWMKNRGLIATSDWALKKTEVKFATDGLSGFLGDHLRVSLHLETENAVHEILLFVKVMPKNNMSKANFIDQNNFFRREMIMYKLFEEMDEADDYWHPNAYTCDENIVVMPDLLAEGYKQCTCLLPLNLDHIMAITTSLARFHAAVANYETNKTIINNKPYTIYEEHKEILKESNFNDNPWLRAAVKLTVNFIEEFSTKYKGLKGLESKLTSLYLTACDGVKEYDETLNVTIHKDLWANNVMFSYDGAKPTSAMLIDFQCMRYAPPAFDMMIMLYLNTSAEFRSKNERMVFCHYYSIFEESISKNTTKRLLTLGYNMDEFCKWCEKSRMFANLVAIAIFPYTLMDPLEAQKNFDDEKTFDVYTNVDRTMPVVKHAYENSEYKERNLEVSEEFLERYVI